MEELSFLWVVRLKSFWEFILMLDVMFYEVFKEEEKALRLILQQQKAPLLVGFSNKTIQEMKLSDVPAKIICIRTQSQIPVEWAQKIEGVLSRSKGDDHLQSYCRQGERKIPYGSLPGYCSRSVAEQAIMLMLNLLKKFKKQVKQFECFDRDNLTGLGCLQRNVLIVGVGEIGEKISDLVKGLGMNVKGVDLIERSSDIEYISLLDGLIWADVIFCALPLTGKTNNILGNGILRKVKNKPIFINISRGEIVSLEELTKLLDEDVLGGFACDVFSQEADLALKLKNKKETFVLELSQRENVIFTPHNAFNSEDALERKASLTICSIQKFLKSKQFLKVL